MSGVQAERLERMPSDIPGLDIILKGGFLKGGLYIVQGAPGTGKTTFGNQLCFNHVAAGGRALYVTLLAEYHARMMQHLGTMSFFDASQIPDQLSYQNGLTVVKNEGLGGLLALLRREISTGRTSLLMLDGIVAAKRAMGDASSFDVFVHELQAVAIATDCTMFMLSSGHGERLTPEHTMVDGIIELADQQAGWSTESYLQVVKFRGSAFLRGRHAFKITDAGIIVHPRIEALLARPSRPDDGKSGRVSSGVDQLDVMLGGGGLPEASTTMVMGPSGTGKTTLGLQYLSRCSADEPGLFFGFYETPARLNAKIAGVCPSLRPLLDSGCVQVQWQPPTDDLLDAYGERLLELVHGRRVRRLFIDGLSALCHTASATPDRMSNFLPALMNEMRVLGVTTLYTLKVPDIMGAAIRSPIGDLSTLAENLILLRFVELRSRLYRLISLLKVRDSDFDKTLHEYTTTSRGLIIDPAFASAERIMADYSRQTKSDSLSDRRMRTRRGR